MIYYIATEIPNKPYIYWQTTDLKSGGLVLPESNLPKSQFGVFPVKIVGGQLENRTPTEMAEFEAQYNVEVVQRNYENKAEALKTATFSYKGLQYPMHSTARLYYKVMERAPGAYPVQSTTTVTNLLQTANAEFLDAYYARLKEITQP